MILTALVAIAIQAGVLDSAECEVFVDGVTMPGERPRAVRLACPDGAENAEGLQSTADTLVAQVDLRFDRRSGYHPVDSIRFELRRTGGWRPVAGQMLIRNVPSIPTRMLEQGWGFRCRYAVSPDATGQVRDPAMNCLTNGRLQRSARRLAERTVRRIAEDSRWFPVPYEYCDTTDFTMNASSSTPMEPSTTIIQLCDPELE
jgi:hypothetical protein